MVVVLDDVLPDFEKYAEQVKEGVYQEVLSQSIIYSDIAQDVSAKDIYSEIEKRTELEPKEKLSFLRGYVDNEDYRHPMWIHSDMLFADYIGVFFVQGSKSPENDGLSLWKNKELDDIKIETESPTKEKYIVDRQTLDKDKWEMWKTVDFKKNRLVICPASYFHSKAKYENVGKTLDDCRIVHVLFFDKRSV